MGRVKLYCETCPFWDKANGCCYFPGDCTLPEEYEILKLTQKTKLSSAYGVQARDDSVEEAQKEVRA